LRSAHEGAGKLRRDAKIERLEMKLRMQRIAYAMLILSFFVGGNVFAANGLNPVQFDGNRLSVQVEGILLGELLMAVEDLTGVQFTFDELVAMEKIFVDFRGLPLSEGIKRMIFPLNCAAIYDDTGRLHKVVILGQWKDAATSRPLKGKSDSPGAPKAAPSDLISLIPKGGSDNSTPPKSTPSEKSPIGSSGPPVDKPYSMDQPPNRNDQVMEGPPVRRAYSSNRKSDTEDQKLEGPPDVGSSDPQPSLDSKPDSKGPLMDGPPVDKSYSIDGPPGWQDQ